MRRSPAESLERNSLIDELTVIDEEGAIWLREQILENKRLDLLSERVLGLKCQPFHKAMQRFALKNQHSLQLVFRGAGKTTMVTVALAIYYILKDPDVRILIVSKSHLFAKKILKEVKGHLENNELLIELFGPFKGETWDRSAIQVSGRTKPMKEPTITTVGIEGQVVGGHYDVVLVDDLVDESNARTAYMREATQTFVNKTLTPTLEPHSRLHYLGTRYHYDDQYARIKNDGTPTQRIKATEFGDGEGRSPWPGKYPSQFFKDLRRKLGKIIFGSQYDCDTDAMKGEIFEYEWLIDCAESDIPAGAAKYMGVDLAISEKSSSDKFAIVLIAVHERIVYVIRNYTGHLKFSAQVDMLIEWNEEYEPVQIGIEINAYQDALRQELEERDKSITAYRIDTKLDKRTRAIKLAPKCEREEVRFTPGNSRLRDQLVAFPGGRYKDLFDALDFAIRTGFRKKRRRGRRGSGDRPSFGVL